MSAKPLRIPIKLSGEAGVRYTREPLTFGVPFAEGAFPVGSTLRAMTADGRVLPLQTSTMTTWKKDMVNIKWLLADLQADTAVDGETVFLEVADQFDPSDRTDRPEAVITTSSSDGILIIDTGALRLKLRTNYERWRHRENDSPIAGCQLKTAEGWRDVLRDEGLLLYMKDQHGNRYTSTGVCPPPRVVVEEQGPLRVCVLITGHLMSAQGVRFCPYRLRMHLYAGKADLRIFHTFIFDQDPTRIQLQAIGLKVLAKTGDGAVAALGGEGATAHFSRNLTPDVNGYATMGAIGCDQVRERPNPGNTTSGQLSILQPDDLHYAARLNDRPFGAGGKAAGWAALGGADSSVVAAIRDFWQEYPKGFHIGRQALDVRIWPEDAPKPLSFITPFDEPFIDFHGTRDEEEIKRLLAAHPTAPLSLKTLDLRGLDDVRWIEDVLERLAPGRTISYNDFLGLGTGVGAAKTTEIVIRFAEGPLSTAEAAAFCAAVQEPLTGIVDPDYLCGTDAFGRFLPAGHPLFVEMDRNLTHHFEKAVIEPIERCRRYGMFMFGHLVNVHAPPGPDAVCHLYKDTEPEKALRYVGPFGNEAGDMVLAVWSQFLRTGERRYLRWAQRASRATADTSFVHAHPGHEENVGCLHYHGAHVWSNSLNRAQSETGFMVTDYYLTGNRRLREVALEAADGLTDNKLEPCGIITCFSPLSREFTGPLAILCEAYQLTWHEKYGDPAQRSLNWLLRTIRTPGYFPIVIYTGGPRGAEAVVDGKESLSPASNPYHFIDPALRLFPSGKLKEFVLAQAQYGHGQVQAYDLTGNRDYAAALLTVVEACTPVIGPGKFPGFYWLDWCDGIPRIMKTVALAAEADPGFWEYTRQWREDRKANPEPPPPKPPEGQGRVSLGVLSTESFVEN